MRRNRQIEIQFPCTWGGKRRGAGRKRTAPRKRVPHRSRPKLASRFPVHVTVRMADGLPRLRGFKVAKVLRSAFVRGCDQGRFRICQFSVQGNHIHLICEAADHTALSRGVQGWKIRVTRRLNRLWDRKGSAFDDRYHAEILKSPRQVRGALRYVLLNARRHRIRLPAWAGGIDPFSSGWYFHGWKDESWRQDVTPSAHNTPVANAHTWLLRKGWRRHGLIALDDVPGHPLATPRSRCG